MPTPIPIAPNIPQKHEPLQSVVPFPSPLPPHQNSLLLAQTPLERLLIQFFNISKMTTQALQKQSIGQLYSEGDFIDAKDNQGDWRVGFIITKNNTTQIYKIRFDGWGSKYDEFYKFNSHRLKPFRTYVIGYTGQKQNPAIRESWKFSNEETQNHIKQLQLLIDNPKDCSIHQLNQSLRGHNYFYVDYLMAVKLPDIESFALVLKFFKLNVQFAVKYLNNIQQHFNDYIKDISSNKELEEMNFNQVYHNSFFEIFDTIYTIFGNYQRLECFFKHNQDYIREQFTLQPAKDHKKYYRQAVSVHLLSFKGMETIESIIKLITKKDDCVPFSFLSPFTHFVEGIVSFFVASFKQNLLENLLKIGEFNVKKLTDNQIKELHRTDVSTFIEALLKISKNTKHSDSIEEWATLLELSLSLKMILCPYFQRKLKGISHIIQVFQRHEVLINKNDQFKVWISKNKLYETLFMVNDNLEIVKKSCELTKFLVLRNLLSLEDIDIIWNSRVGKHETVVKQIYNLIGEIPYYEKQTKQNLKLFEKVSTLPKDQWDEDYIHMIRQFSQNSYGFNTREHMVQTFGFDLIYEYALTKETEFAISQLVSLMNFFQSSDIFNKFQQNCFTEISKKNKEKTYIKILLQLFKENIETFHKLELPLNIILTNHLMHNCNSQDTAMVSDAFELLLGVVKSTAKEIEIQSFIAIWKAFCNSSNKSLFLSWLYKKKDNGRIFLSHCLNEKLKKYLLANLWTKEEEFKRVNEEEVILIIELFKYTNDMAQTLRKPHPMTIQVLSTELPGYDILWNVVKYSQDDKAAFLICDFLAEIYTSYQESKIQEAINFHGQNLIKAIKQTLTDKHWNYLIRLLTLMKKTIDFDDQILTSKYNNRHQFMKEYTVIRKDTQQELLVKFSCTSHFYDFKKFIGSKIGIPMHQFYLVNAKGIQLTREHFFKSLIEPPLTGGKFHLLLRDEKSIIKHSFNQYLDVLFNLLDDKRIEKLVWNIVERLPISEQLKQKVNKTQDIFYELSHVGFYKELYMLRVMLELSDSWWIKLSKIKKMTEILSCFKKVTFKTQVEEEYVIAQTNIIIKLVKVIKGQHEPIPDHLFPSLLPMLTCLLTTVEKENSKSLEAEEKIIHNILVIADLLPADHNIMHQLIKSDCLENLFYTALITLPVQQLRKRFIDEFKIILKHWNAEKEPQLLIFLLGKLLNNAIAFKNKDHLKEYFVITSHVLTKTPATVLGNLYKNELKGLVPKLFDLVRKEKLEETNQALNKALEGYLTLLKHMVSLESQKMQNQILAYLINECLFSENDPKCKSSASRREGFSVLLELSETDKNVLTILPYLSQLHKRGNWRSKRFQDWGITLNDKQKSTTGYVGLKNLGCICYMNSFNQQLFMIPYFRYSITNADDSNTGAIKPEQNVLHQVQKMFMNLEYSQKKSYNPKPFCFSFKDYEGNPTNVTQQMDIDEYSNILFDRLENQLKGTQYSTLIKDMFGGVFSNQIVGKGCPHYSESQQPFLSISLTVKNKKNIDQSFKNMITGDTLDGDNAYYCERCSKKVSAVKRMSIKKLPNHLIITLKRFQFDYQRMMKLKVNDYCEFPHNLNLKEYSQQYLRKQENSKAEQEEQFPNEYYNYVLKGFVIHLGHADSGHYYSIIQDRITNKWYEYNDTTVREFDISELAEEAYGGETGVYDIKEKIKNAYMVIYERQKKIVIGNEIPFKREAIKRKESSEKILSEIVKENRDYKLQNILFSREYTRYLLGMLTKSDKLEASVERKILKYSIVFYLTITIRQKNEGLNEFVLKRINKGIEKYPELAEWVMHLFSIQKMYDEFFLNNPYRQTRKSLAYWLVGLSRISSPQVKTFFCNSLVNRVSSRCENNLEVSLILSEMASSDKQILVYLIKNNILGRMLPNISKQKNQFKELLDVPSNESEIGYQEVIEKTLLQELKSKKLRQAQSQNEHVWNLSALIIEYTQSNNTTLKKLFSQAQFQSLFLTESKIYKMLEQLKSKYAIYSFSKFISHLTINNEQFLKNILNLIFNGLKEFQSKRYRQFMLLAEEIINIKDDLLPMRLECLKKIVDALKFNEQYSSDSNIIQQWIVILLNRNQNLRKYLVSEVELLDYLAQMAVKKVPSDQISRKNKKFNDSMINKLHGVKFLCSKRGYLRLAEQIRQFYLGLTEQIFEPSPLWPSIPDNYMKSKIIGDKVAYYDMADKLEYEESTITNLFLGKVELTQGKNKTFTIWKDDEKFLSEMPPASECEYSEGSSSVLTDQLQDDDTNIDYDV